MQNFAYHRPKSLAEAVTALENAEEGKLLAGGQSLLPVMKLNLAEPTDVISIAGLDELRGIRRAGDRLVIGAATTHAEVSESREVTAALPALAELATGIGDPQVRNRGTLGGSVAHCDPAADYPAAVVALAAEIATNRRRIAADAFFTGMFECALEPGEIITEVGFVIPNRAKYMKFPNPASRFAVVGVMVAQYDAEVRVAVVGAGPSVFRVDAMEQALASRFDPAVLDGISVASDDLVGDMHASAEFRAHLVQVMAKRAVSACA